MTRRAWILAGLLLCVAPASARELPAWLHVAEPTVARAEYEVELPPRERLDAMEGAGFGYVDLRWHSESELLPSGVVRGRELVVRHFLTDAGVQSGATVSFGANRARDDVTVDAAFVWDEDGSRIPLPKVLIEVVDPQTPDVFGDAATVMLPYPGVSPGRTLVMDIRIERRVEDWPFPWSEAHWLKSAAPIVERKLRLRWPASVQVDWTTDDPEAQCEQTGTTVLCLRRDVDGLQADGEVASYVDLVPGVAVGVRESWDDFGRRLRGLVLERAAASPEVERRAAKLTRGIASEREKLERIYRFVADDIRYVALAHGASAVVPKPAETTLSQRFGDCKDKVTLLMALGREAGLDVVPVLTSSERYRLERLLVPSSSYFDHMIACVNLAEETICLDPTVLHGELALPHGLQGAVALELGSDPMEPSQLPRDQYGWRIDVQDDVAFDCDGRVTRITERRYGGPVGNTYRQQLLALQTRDRERWISEEYHSTLALDAEARFEIQDLEDPSTPFAIVSHAGDEHVGEAKGDYYDIDPWLVSYARALIAENQVHDQRMPGMHYRAVTDYQLCGETARKFFGPALNFESPWGSLTRRYAKTERGIRVETNLALEAGDLSPSDQRSFRAFLSSSLDQTRIWISLD